MKKLLLPLTTLFFSITLYGQQNANEVATLLFANVKTTLSPAAKNQIASRLGFLPSGNKDQPFIQDKESKEYPFGAIVVPTDLNKDGIEEVFIIFGNSYTSGHTGSSVILFIKNMGGIYTEHLGFPGTSPDILTTSNKGYPDLVIGGPGFEFPVLRWNGKTYTQYKTVKDADYSNLKKVNVESLRKTN